MYHGIINVYKEPGYTSHDVVARLRGILRQKKIGHTGTLIRRPKAYFRYAWETEQGFVICLQTGQRPMRQCSFWDRPQIPRIPQELCLQKIMKKH